MLDSPTLLAIIPNAPADTILSFLNAAMIEASVADMPIRTAMWLAQWNEESEGFNRTVENLNYSADGLLKTFPTHFTPQLASQYARQPERIANHVYANRFGNGDEASGDGWKYRGRAVGQVTFHDNYKACGDYLGIDLISQPDQLATPQYAFRAAAWYWRSHSLNAMADTGNVRACTKLINGGYNGLDERQRVFDLAKQVLGIQ